MSLINFDKEKLQLMAYDVKKAALHGSIPKFDDIVTVCNELLKLLDQLPMLEKAVKCLKLAKEIRNLASNL